MAARTLYPNQSTMNWSAATWSLADDDAEDESKPINGDTVIFEGSAGVVTLDENTAQLAAFTLGAGTIVGTGFTLYVGDLTYTAGTATNLTVEFIAGTHDVDWAAGNDAARLLAASVPNGAKLNLTGHAIVKEWTFGNGVDGVSVTTAAAKDIYLFRPATDPWHQPATAGTIAANRILIWLSGGTADVNIGRLDGSGCDPAGVDVRGDDAATSTVTMTGDWTTGVFPLAIQSGHEGRIAVLDTAGHNLTAGAIMLGGAADSDKSGSLDLSTGTHSIASLAAGHPTGNLANALDFATCALALSGTLDGDNIACTTTGAVGVGGAVENVTVAAGTLVHLLGTNAGNSGVTELAGLPLGTPYVGVAA